MDAIRRIVRVLRESARGADEAVGVSGAQLFVMQRLARAGSMTVTALATATATHQSSVSVVVQRLVERSLATRTVATADRRRREVTLTAAGRRLLQRAPSAAQHRLIAGLTGMPAGHRRDLAELVRVMGADREPADMFFEDQGRPSMAGHGSRVDRGPRPRSLAAEPDATRRRQAPARPRPRSARPR